MKMLCDECENIGKGLECDCRCKCDRCGKKIKRG